MTIKVTVSHLTEGVKFRAAQAEDCDFLYELHRATMKTYVDQTWGWDEAFQQTVFRRNFNPAEVSIITLTAEDIGVISLEKNESDVFLRAIEIHPAWQGQGIGTFILQTILDEASQKGVPVILYVLKVNPVRKLYERLGFKIVSETATHYVMKTEPKCLV